MCVFSIPRSKGFREEEKRTSHTRLISQRLGDESLAVNRTERNRSRSPTRHSRGFGWREEPWWWAGWCSFQTNCRLAGWGRSEGFFCSVVGGSLSGLMVFMCLKELLFPCRRFHTSVSFPERAGFPLESLLHFFRISQINVKRLIIN